MIRQQQQQQQQRQQRQNDHFLQERQNESRFTKNRMKSPSSKLKMLDPSTAAHNHVQVIVVSRNLCELKKPELQELLKVIFVECDSKHCTVCCKNETTKSLEKQATNFLIQKATTVRITSTPQLSTINLLPRFSLVFIVLLRVVLFFYSRGGNRI